MPTYNGVCTECGEELEAFCPYSERQKMVCPECGGKIEWGIGGGNFILKGGGWFKDGYS